MIKGIGKQTARRIVDKFGADTLNIIESRPEELATVKGITLKKAQAIQAEFLQKAGMRRLVEFLTQFQLPVSLALALWRRYADRAIDILRSDPYLLLDEELGVRFADADRIAAACGIGPQDLLRVEAGIQYTLTHNLGNGHCFLPQDRLLPAAQKLLRLEDPQLMAEGLDELRLQGKVVLTPVAGVMRSISPELYENESYIVQRIAEMCQRELRPPDNLEQLIDQVAGRAAHHLCPGAALRRPHGRPAADHAAHRRAGHRQNHQPAGHLGAVRGPGPQDHAVRPHRPGRQRLGEPVRAERLTIHRSVAGGGI